MGGANLHPCIKGYMMSNRKTFERLIKLGNRNPSLRDHIAPVLQHIRRQKSSSRNKTAGKRDIPIDELRLSVDDNSVVHAVDYLREVQGLTFEGDPKSFLRSGNRMSAFHDFFSSLPMPISHSTVTRIEPIEKPFWSAFEDIDISKISSFNLWDSFELTRSMVKSVAKDVLFKKYGDAVGSRHVSVQVLGDELSQFESFDSIFGNLNNVRLQSPFLMNNDRHDGYGQFFRSQDHLFEGPPDETFDKDYFWASFRGLKSNPQRRADRLDVPLSHQDVRLDGNEVEIAFHFDLGSDK
jgi:hypothetical protein